MKPATFSVGDRARKVGGSYQATGTIRAVFITRNGEQRFVFDFDEPPGLLHIAEVSGAGTASAGLPG